MRTHKKEYKKRKLNILSNYNDLALEAVDIRHSVIDMAVLAKDGHITSAFSMVEILLVLYSKVLKHNPQNPNWEARDIFILSKGHGCASLYCVLANKGYFPKSELDKFAQPGGILGGHPDRFLVPGVEVSTGSLGQGMSMAVGYALSAKIKKSLRHVYCIIGDGECNEGSVWEAAAFAAHHKLDNLTIIVDFNGFQSSGELADVLDPKDFTGKWKAFGFSVTAINGHDFAEIHSAFKIVTKDTPHVVIAHTVKGKGVSFMENTRKWHTTLPSIEEYIKACRELDYRKAQILGSGGGDA